MKVTAERGTRLPHTPRRPEVRQTLRLGEGRSGLSVTPNEQARPAHPLLSPPHPSPQSLRWSARLVPEGGFSFRHSAVPSPQHRHRQRNRHGHRHRHRAIAIAIARQKHTQASFS
eukprot:2305845-Pleurochrysis_carterae.AAC.1